MLNQIYKPDFSNFSQMLKRNYIRALVVYSKTDFFFDHGSAKGLQVEVLQQYEKYLNKDIKNEADKVHIIYIPVTFSELIPALIAGKGDIAASLLTFTQARQKLVAFSSSNTRYTSEILVSHKDAKAIDNIEDLSGQTLYVLNNSSYVEHLEQLNEKFKIKKLAPVIIQQADEHLLSEDILELVNSGIKKYTFIDDYKGKLWAKVLPDIRLHNNLMIGKNNQLGWAVRKDNIALQESLNGFGSKVRKGTLLGNMLFNRYFKNISWLKNPNTDNEQANLDR